MTRQSTDERGPNGELINGFDYDCQVWVRGGIVQTCGHPDHMSRQHADGSLSYCCNARRFYMMTIEDTRAGLGFPRDARDVEA
jgi:hypothetical protein